MITRDSIIRGPALVKYGTAGSEVSFWTRGDIELNYNLDTFNIDTSMHGKVDERVKEVLPTISFTPVGEWENLAVLFPYLGTINGVDSTFKVGSSVLGAADKNLIIHTLAGKIYTFPCAAITKMPDVTLSATKPLLGACTFTAFRKYNTAWTAASSLVTITSGALADTTFDPAKVITQPYTCAWTAPMAAFETQEGLTIAFDLGLDPVETDSYGVLDMTIRSLGVMARCVPLGGDVTEASLLSAMKLQDTGNARGRSLLAGGADFIATGVVDSTVVATVKNAAIKQAGYRFGNTVLRVGEVGFVGNRSFPSGVPSMVFALAST